ncbi:hybrid sensor histidine kinase/response regulator [Azospirillum rugosum]|uniref:histidine kinase n=1 Tax=Azospirillum rugosum TaxID=416170 RepID=A0ABS4SK35_9PROT|nr:PAS domain-containing protein [Azospirillum rugosum]MBP2292312.1 PAS domain S-box-containing protein [Azospirillum rugosum]MDQ0526071.1 PAS domain S-box-containing protein [Azospirillum rugosum]
MPSAGEYTPGRRQLYLLITAALLPAALCAVLLVILSIGDARRQVEDELMRAADTLALSLDQMVAEEVAALSVLAAAPSLDSGDMATFRRLATQVVEQRGTWGNVVVADRDRQLLNTRLPADAPLPPPLDPDAVARIFDTGHFLLKDVERVPERSAHPFVSLAVPVVRADTVRYVLLAKIPATAFRARLQGKLAGHGQAAVIDRSGRVVALTSLGDPADPRIAAPVPQPFAEATPGGIATVALPDGRDAMAAAAVAPESGWRVALVQPAGAFGSPLVGLGPFSASPLLVGLILVAMVLAGATAVIQARLFRSVTALSRQRVANRYVADVARHVPGLIHRHALLPNGAIRATAAAGAMAPGTSAPATDLWSGPSLPVSPRMAEALRESAATMAPLCLDEEYAAAGETRWRRVTAVPRRVPGGAVLWDGVTVDVTDLRRSEASLRESETLLRLAQEAAGMGSWDWDLSTGRVQWSDGLHRILGLEPGADALDIATFAERFVHAEDRQLVLATAQRAAVRRETVWMEYRILRKDGAVRWLECTGTSTAGPDGRPSRLLGIVQDVTERKATDEALHAANLALEHEVEQHRRTEAMLQSLYNTAPAGMCVIDSQLRYLHINERLASANGLPVSAHIGRPLRDILPPALVDAIEPLYRRVLTTGEPLYDGVAGGPSPCSPCNERQYLFNLYPLRLPDGTVHAVNAVVQDVTDRRAMEETLRAALEDAQAANAAKARFFAAASHDLRQPVQTLFLFVHALGERLRDHPAQALVATMQQALEGLKALIDTLLDISRLDSGTLAADPADFPAVTLMQRLSADYAPRMAAKGLKFRMVGSPVWIRSDSVLLGRILGNLLDNALKYTGEGGVLLTCRRRGDTARIEVWDTGAGIAPEDQAAIFDEFVQVGPNRRDRTQGLGLGLSIVRRLATLLGHELSMRSVPGRGSVFAVTVPLAAEIGDTAHPPPLLVAAEKDGPPLAVILDDDATILTALTMLLEEWGFETVGSTAAEDALAQIAQRRRRPDVIIADYHLPDDRTGTDAIRRIRAYCNAPVPSIVLTGDTGPNRALEVGRIGSHLLQKPVMPDMLQDMIHRLSGVPRR